MIRPAGAPDLVSLAALYHRVWHETHGSHMPRAERDARDERFFLNRMASLMPNVVVCEDAGTIVGFVAWTGSLLGQLFLDAHARGSGSARSLIEAAESGLRAQGVAEAELHCLVGNERAKRFYERGGWHVSEIMAAAVRGDMGGEQRDFWVMRKRLAPHGL
ncbi:GNAT family N-acetyltransferase [Methylobacterium terricola]|uniref:GNAT family N-acetyltransferase n=1 Tax=Methylobacterium terricola TaxID=2583531 RepID=UPI001487362B|nr:GNAT family N-acetyltransferase [Methylobacterium terricola]